jgi:hypothetical protein
MKEIEQLKNRVVDLYWLAFLLTGRREVSVDIATETIAAKDAANPFFSHWIVEWSRKLVIARALEAIGDELSASARCTDLKVVNKPELPARDWSLDPGTTKVELEKALLAIDVFPRAALLLLVFEGLALDDVTVLLNEGPALVRKAQAIALAELTRNLATMQGWQASAADASRDVLLADL